MTPKSPSLRLVVACELVTAAWSPYSLTLMHGGSVGAVDRLLKAVAALLIGIAVWKRTAWAPTAVVLLAAYIGIPTLLRLSETVAMWQVGLLPPSDLWLNAGDLAVEIAQVVALVGGLRELRSGRSAAHAS